MEPTIAELQARIAVLEQAARDAVKPIKVTRAASKLATKARKDAEKARKAQFKADRWERLRRGKTLNRYAIS